MLLPYENFYPGQVTQHPEDDLCTVQKVTRQEKYEIEEKGWFLLSNCE